ncbi:MAG: class I SAM-dependent methyltransferase [Pseudomonadota bacterium]
MTSRNHFDATVAAMYDRDHGGNDPKLVANTVERLTELSAGRPILEFAIGTGRIALPLAARGCAVSGIDLSSAMVAELRKKETGAPLEIAIGDMTTTHMPGDFSLVFLVFNTIDNLTTQDAQVACFQNAARHLLPGGRFVVETLVPPLQDLPHGATKRAFACDPDHMGVDEFDVVTQSYTSHHVWTKKGQTQRVSVPFRYAWPAEMDLMARIAGLDLEHRWSDWQKSPFTNKSRVHISVWRKRG